MLFCYWKMGSRFY